MVLSSFIALALQGSPGQGREAPLRAVALRCRLSPPRHPTSQDGPPGRDLDQAQLEPLLDLTSDSRGLGERLARLASEEMVVSFDPPDARGESDARPPHGPLWLDLGHLASLLLPGHASYRPSTVARALGVPAEECDDPAEAASTAAWVFVRLLEEIERLDPDTLMHVNRLAAPLDWPFKRLFALAERALMRKVLTAPPSIGASGLAGPLAGLAAPAARPREPLVPAARRQPLDVGAVVALLGRNGSLARSLPGFEERPEQLAMCRRVAAAFNGESPVLVEAGTGTGKSLAYLLPAVCFAVANRRRVVVSTNTINLQDQLFHKDLPEVQRATGLSFKVALLKGRTNYLCLRRWFALLRAADQADHERTLLIKTLFWLRSTTSGDRAELSLTGREEEAWSRVCALAETCTPLNCQFHRAGVCFLARARRAAEEAHLVIVNHALLLADTVSRSRVLPEFQHLIIDEAHHLEREATTQLGWHTSQREVHARLGLLLDASHTPASGLVAEVLRLLRRDASAPGRREAEAELAALERQAAEAVERARAQTDEVFAHLRSVLQAHGQPADGQTVVRLSSALRAQPMWNEVELGWDELAARVRRLGGLLAELERRAGEHVSGDADAWAEVAPELAAQRGYWEELHTRLAAILGQPQPGLIAWLTAARNDDLYVSCAPLHVGPLLRESLFAEKETLVLTSATLSTQGHFRYVKERLGLEDADELALGSPFDYRRAALVLLPSDVPEPSRAGYQQAVERAILDLAVALEGRCLALFTSYAQLRATSQALRQPLATAGIALLAQGENGLPRATLLEAFKQGRRTVLFGTSSFWEGVDVVGDALSCVIMPRLPFSVPTDPIFEARSEQFEDPFGQYAVPQAILRFKQGFGRLIRSRADRGAVVMLDRRLETRSYGRAFLRSLPGCTFERAPLAHLGQRVRTWLDGSG